MEVLVYVYILGIVIEKWVLLLVACLYVYIYGNGNFNGSITDFISKTTWLHVLCWFFGFMLVRVKNERIGLSKHNM